jgi:hypothetical protein
MKNNAESIARKDIMNDSIPYIDNSVCYIEVWDVCVSHIFTTINRRLNRKLINNK